MFRRLLPIVPCVAILFAGPPSACADPLYWDVVPGDGQVISGGAGTWKDGYGNWNDGIGDVNWDNNASAIADFGSGASASGDRVVTVEEAVRASGIVSRKAYTFMPALDALLDPIQLEGQTPSIQVGDVTKFYVSIATGSGVESVNLAGLGTSTTPNKYLYLYAENTFNAPLIIGSDPAVAAGVLVMPSALGALGGSSSAGITILPGSCLSIRTEPAVYVKPFTISGDGGGRGSLQLRTSTGGYELQGSITLANDATIETWADNTISGAIAGDYVLTFQNATTSYITKTTLSNPANSTKGLNIDSDGTSTAIVTVQLTGNYTATEYVRIARHGIFMPGTYLSTPLITLDAADAVLDVSAAGITLVDGMTLQGRGTVIGAVTAADGSIVSPGTTTGTLNITGDLDMSAGAGMTWSLGSLTDNTTGVVGADFDLLSVSGILTLGGASELTLDFTAVGNPGAAETFWSSDHDWTIATAGTLMDNFVSITNPTWATGAFATSIVDNGVLLRYVASTALPIPGDTNGDSRVDATDARKLAENWGNSVGAEGFTEGDFNGDGVVNALDASILAANWGDYTGGESAAGLPEPSSIILLTTCLAMLLVRRRH